MGAADRSQSKRSRPGPPSRQRLDDRLARTANLGAETRGWISGADASIPPCEPDLIARPPLTDRLAPALVDLGLRRGIDWQEAEFVLSAVRYIVECGQRDMPEPQTERLVARARVLQLLAKHRNAAA